MKELSPSSQPTRAIFGSTTASFVTHLIGALTCASGYVKAPGRQALPGAGKCQWVVLAPQRLGAAWMPASWSMAICCISLNAVFCSAALPR